MSKTPDTLHPFFQERISTIKGLLGPTEVAIDGVIYDLKDFEHPGGESIMVFLGSNDVTATYNMIHPYHTSKHLEKMNDMIALQSDSFW